MNCSYCKAAVEPGARTCPSCGRPVVVPPVGPGSVVASRYRLLQELGAGGMGVVFKAHDQVLDEVVALKVLRTGASRTDLQTAEAERMAALASRFRTEIKLAWRIRHRNVCGIHEYGEDGDLLYISMELVDGRDLRRLIREKAFLWEEAYDVVVQVAEGLEAIHDAGVIHRDLKPANIMLDSKGVVRLMDFGIAKVWGSGSGSGVTRTGHVVGSPEYMSPEQVRDQDLDFRSDLYSLAVVVYEVFTGRAPFKADTPMATMLRHLEQPPPLDGPEAARIPVALLPILRRALAKTPEDRYPDCASMRKALEAARLAIASQVTEDVPRFLSAVPSRPSTARLLVPQLLRALHHPDPTVRRDAADALAAIDADRSRVVPSLRDARQRDDDPRVRAAAEAALARLGPEPVTPEPQPPPPPAPLPPQAQPSPPEPRPLPPRPATPEMPKAAPAVPAPPPPAPPVARVTPIREVPRRRPAWRTRLGVAGVAVGLALLLGLALRQVYVGVQERPPAVATPRPSPTTLPATPLQPSPASAQSPAAAPSPTRRAAALPAPPLVSRTTLASAEPAVPRAVVTAPEPAPTTTLAALPTPEPVERTAITPSPTPIPPPSTLPAPRPGQLVGLTDPGVRPPRARAPLAAAHTLMTDRLKLAGSVELSVLVDEKGNVAEARVLHVESRPGGAEFETVLRDAALKSAQRWHFDPAQQSGVAVRVWLPVRIDF